MELLKEHLEIDFYFDGKEMTAKDQKRVSDFIAKKKKVKSKTKISKIKTVASK